MQEVRPPRPRRGKADACDDLCRQTGKCCKTRRPPASEEETLEIFAFRAAADLSRQQGGAPVALREVLEKARAAPGAADAEAEAVTAGERAPPRPGSGIP